MSNEYTPWPEDGSLPVVPEGKVLRRVWWGGGAGECTYSPFEVSIVTAADFRRGGCVGYRLEDEFKGLETAYDADEAVNVELPAGVYEHIKTVGDSSDYVNQAIHWAQSETLSPQALRGDENVEPSGGYAEWLAQGNAGRSRSEFYTERAAEAGIATRPLVKTVEILREENACLTGYVAGLQSKITGLETAISNLRTSYGRDMEDARSEESFARELRSFLSRAGVLTSPWGGSPVTLWRHFRTESDTHERVINIICDLLGKYNDL